MRSYLLLLFCPIRTLSRAKRQRGRGGERDYASRGSERRSSRGVLNHRRVAAVAIPVARAPLSASGPQVALFSLVLFAIFCVLMPDRGSQMRARLIFLPNCSRRWAQLTMASLDPLRSQLLCYLREFFASLLTLSFRSSCTGYHSDIKPRKRPGLYNILLSRFYTFTRDIPRRIFSQTANSLTGSFHTFARARVFLCVSRRILRLLHI